jgi:uncharacterized protein HemY
MPQAVYVLWTILLIVAVLAIPALIFLLHQVWRAARHIEQYFKDMKAAGVGIAENTGHVEALEDTVSVAGTILSTAAQIDEHAKAVEETLGERAAKRP